MTSGGSIPPVQPPALLAMTGAMMISIPARAALLLLAIGVAPPAAAQSGLEPRVDRLEREMRAVQRKVFPNGAAPTVEPQITAPQTTTAPPGAPIASPIANLEARVDALEGQFTTLTGQIEQTQFRLRQIEEQFNAYKKATDARLTALERAAVPVDAPAIVPTVGAAAPATATGTAAASAVEKPDTGDAGEDDYIYGYRLWAAKQYPAAQTQLKKAVAAHPDHRRASYARNLLGRAYLDGGKPQDAAKAFYDNYVKLPTGDRAADSLFYLSKALQSLKAAPAEICKVYTALESEYPGKISLEQQAEVDRGKAAAKCK